MNSLLTTSQRRFAEAAVGLTYCNPFLPERVEYERQALGDNFNASMAEWNLRGDIQADHANVRILLDQSEQLLDTLRGKLQHMKPPQKDLQLYKDLVRFALYYRYRETFDEIIEAGEEKRKTPTLSACFSRFEKAMRHFLFAPHFEIPSPAQAAHLFACFFQVRRAFHYIFRNIIGVSQPAARFRASAWQSIFSHDLRRYRSTLYRKMGDITTLIIGPSGTGKELAARAIAMSQYIPFDPKGGRFVAGFHSSLHPVNLSALSPTLIESELFGHVAGAFTGAVKNRRGRLDECGDTEAVFLDEIGDIDTEIQVKLLRVLQDRVFQRIGDNEDRHFCGKVIAATNRNLARQMQAGRFREDLYYRLCADVIAAPSLRERLQAQPDELPDLVLFIARRLVESEADALAEEVIEHIHKCIGPDYHWPGNVRELEQCVRNVLVRGEYLPRQELPVAFEQRLAQEVSAGSVTIDELLRRYCTLVYMRAGSYEEAARRLHVDRRTIKGRVDQQLLEQLRMGKSDEREQS